MDPNPHLTLHPTPNMIRAAEFQKPVNVKYNNKMVLIEIPENRRNIGFEELIMFIRSHPLKGAFLFSTAIYPQMLNEWWYTAVVNNDQTSITGTYNNGRERMTITEEIIREALSLPTIQEAGPGGFEEKLPKQRARDEAFPLVGQNQTRKVIRYNLFTGKWKFLFSIIVRSLGGKTGSLNEMNEFETHIFHSIVTGRRISYSKLYFDELVSLLSSTTRVFNTPFIRLLSLCFEEVLGETRYKELDQIFYEIPAPCLDFKIFHVTITNAEIGITLPMQRWIENPFHELTDSEADQTASEDEVVSSGTSSGNGDGDGPPEVVSSPAREETGLDILVQTLEPELNPTQPQVHTEMPTSPVTNPLESHTPKENIHISETPLDDAHLEISNQENVGQDPHSSAAAQPNTTQSELVVELTAKTTQTSQLGVDSLEKHTAAPTQTHVGSIEDDVSLLDIPKQDLGPPPPPFSSTVPAQKALAHYKRAHNKNPQTSLHSSAQVRTDFPKEQGKSQTSNSAPSDLPPYNQEKSEGTTTLHNVTGTTPTQSEVPLAVPQLLKAIRDLSTQFDDKLSGMQAEIQALKETHSKEMAEMRKSINDLTAEIAKMKKNEAGVSQTDDKEGQTEGRDGQTEGINSQTEGNLGQTEGGEGQPKEVLGQSEAERANVDQFEAGGAEIQPESEVLVAQTQGEKSRKGKEKMVETEKGASRVKIESEPTKPKPTFSKRKAIPKVKKQKKKTRYNPKTERMDEYLTDDSEATISESELQELEELGLVTGRKRRVLISSDEDEVPFTQTKTTEMKSQSELKGNRSEQVKETGMSSKSKGKEVVTDEWLIAKAKQLKVEPSYEAVMEKAAFNAGMSVDRYKKYISELHKESLYEAKFDEVKDDSELAAEQLEKEMREEEEQALKEEQLRVQADKDMSKKIQQEQARMSFIEKHFIKRRWKRSLTHLESYIENGKIICKCLLEGGEIRTVEADRLYTLGLAEWKQIANMSVRLKSEELKAYVKKEAIYNVNAAHIANKLEDEEFKEFCIAHNCHRGAKSLGLESQEDHPVPAGLVFKNRSYIKTNQHEGLFYVDCSGAECFQDINSLYKSSLYHCIALMNECKKDRCLPFRVRLTSWLFNNLLRIKQIGEVDDKVELIKKEFQRLHNKSDEEMEKLIKWKFEKTEWVKSALKQSVFQAPPKAKAKRRRR